VCFSLEADLAAAAVLTPVGVLAVREARGARRLLPLAALPLLLAAHQAIEAVVWLGLDGHVDPGIQAAAVRAYLLIAAPLLPMLVPVALILAEDVPARRRAMWPWAAVGWAAGLWLLWVVLANPVEARELDHAIDFRTEPSLELAAGAVYLAPRSCPRRSRATAGCARSAPSTSSARSSSSPRTRRRSPRCGASGPRWPASSCSSTCVDGRGALVSVSSSTAQPVVHRIEAVAAERRSGGRRAAVARTGATGARTKGRR
jgi:hypothetical protein